ncbi:hypothetical protein OS493_019603 [Desmophyllum pertusum]|uniref:Myb/SANT-like DNA-binding domain-containing protein n=1 Tax=Desmophyllum pertusum TaxID=174260 RepID=A0A9W9ZEX9_9CNID|nr:hypothetical protein OS493_019603 [Desmophyllum pertusum]
MASKSARTTNFSEEEKLLLAELGREFPEVENKGYNSNALTKKAKAWDEILRKFNSQNPNGIKRDLNQIQGCWKRLKIQSKKEHDMQRRESRKTGGGKAPASPSQVCKVVADVIPASVNPLEQEFDDDAEGEPNSSRGKHQTDTSTYEVGPSAKFADVEVIASRKEEKVSKKEDSQRCKRKRSDSTEKDPFLLMAMEEHKLKMKVLQLKEWKLVHQCTKMGISVPPGYELQFTDDM